MHNEITLSEAALDINNTRTELHNSFISLTTPDNHRRLMWLTKQTKADEKSTRQQAALCFRMLFVSSAQFLQRQQPLCLKSNPQSFPRPIIFTCTEAEGDINGDRVGKGNKISNIIRTRIKRLGLDYFLLHHGPERPIRSKAEIFGRRIISECIIEMRRQEWEDEDGSGVINAVRDGETRSRAALSGRVCLDSKHGRNYKPDLVTGSAHDW